MIKVFALSVVAFWTTSFPYSPSLGIDRHDESPHGGRPYSEINFNEASDFLLFDRKAMNFEVNSLASGCWEIQTFRKTYGYTTPAVDTRIYFYQLDSKGNGTYVSLDDDSGEGYFSKARIFVSADAYLGNIVTRNLAITGYDTSINDKYFFITTAKVGTTLSECNNGTPMVEWTRSSLTLHNAN